MESKFKQYTGTKTVKAMFMGAGEAKRCGANLTDEVVKKNLGNDGYLVEYPDGYRSWSPAPVFEEAYRPSETYEERMRLEYIELGKRIQRATNYLYEPCVPRSDNERELLSVQVDAMVRYFNILRMRLNIAEEASNKRIADECLRKEGNNGTVD